MKKQMEMYAITNATEEIGTTIFDATLPSNINFDQSNSPQKSDKKHDSPHSELTKLSSNINPQIKSYAIKGKVLFNIEPAYKINDVISEYLPTIQVKAFDDELSSGLKKIWELVIGYTKRYIYIRQGYVYLMEKKKQSLVVLNIQKLENLFKFFVDSEQKTVRLVFRSQSHEGLITKNYCPVSYEELIQRLLQETTKIGLKIIE